MSDVIDMEFQDGVNVGGGSGSDEIWLPSVNSNGDLSWSKSSTSTAPETVNIKGPAGADGAPGAPGADGEDGTDGRGVQHVSVNGSNHLIISYDDGTSEDAGEIQGGGGSSDPDALPSFYVTEYDDTIHKVQQLALNSSDSFAFGATSDLHFCTEDSQFSDTEKDKLRSGVIRMMKAFGKFSRQFPLATTMIIGDYAYFFDNTVKQNDVDNLMEINEWMTKFDGPKIVLRGNHEYKYSGDESGIGLDIDEFYDICSKKYVRGKIEKISKTVYYQIDDVDGVCFLYINALYAPVLNSQLSTEIRAVMAKNTSSYPYIISTHYGMENKQSGQNVYTVQGVKDVIDFVKTEGGSIIAWIAGHAHSDWHDVYNNTLIMVTEAAGYYSTKVSEDGQTYSKTLNTANESAFSIYTVDKEMGKLYCTRFGAGADRVYHYNDHSGAIGSATDYEYTITQNLTDVSSDFTKTGTDGNATIELTPSTPGDTITATVMMGSTDITSTAWNSSTGTVSISNASDDIIITASTSTPPQVTTLISVSNADSVGAYAGKTANATVTTNGDTVNCSILKGKGGFTITKTLDATAHAVTSADNVVFKCDDFTCDMAGGNLPGYVQLTFYDSNNAKLGYITATSGTINVPTVLAAMKAGTEVHAATDYWQTAVKVDFDIRASTNGETTLETPQTLNVVNPRIELATS